MKYIPMISLYISATIGDTEGTTLPDSTDATTGECALIPITIRIIPGMVHETYLIINVLF